MMEIANGDSIQGQVLGRGDAVSPYSVQSTDALVEFTSADTVTCTLADGTTTDTTVLEGSRYAIGNGVVTIVFAGTFNIS